MLPCPFPTTITITPQVICFNGIPNCDGNSMLNPVYAYIVFSKGIVCRYFINEPELICLHIVEFFKHCYQILIIQFNSSHLLNGFKNMK